MTQTETARTALGGDDSTTNGAYEADVIVESKSTVAEGVVKLVLRHADNEQLPEWEPGAHVDLVLSGDITRQYSLMGDPADRSRWEVGILREPESRGGSLHVHDVLNEGDRVGIRGPRNHFELVDATGYHFVAGGIGITPMLPMIRHAEARGLPWTLSYGGRSRSSMAFVDELERYGERVDLYPQDTRGFPDLDRIVRELPSGFEIYCCGPEGLLTALESTCDAAGAAAPHLERFAPKNFDDAVNTAFDIELRESGIELHVPADKSILEVVRGAGVDTVASCEEGTCGTCEIGVVEGIPDHRDSVLSAEEHAQNDYMMICVSRSCSKRLILEM